MLIDLVIMIVTLATSPKGLTLLWWLTGRATLDRAVFLNARVYVMTQCKGHAGTFVARGSKTVAACCRIVSRTIGTAGFTKG
jgi:hypothetical protein